MKCQKCKEGNIVSRFDENGEWVESECSECGWLVD